MRNLAPFGWTWNFAHAGTWLLLMSTVVTFVGVPAVVYSLGIRSGAVFGILGSGMLVSMMLLAHRLAKDPST